MKGMINKEGDNVIEAVSNQDLIVVKFGSRSLTGNPGSLSTLEQNIKSFVDDLHRYAGRLVIVSSGAVFCGRLLSPDLEDLATLATIGNPALAAIWQKSFSESGVSASQILVTHRELDIPEERLRLKSVLAKALSLGVVPIINENDALSNEELKKLTYGGDNDGLAAEVGKLIEARHLVICSDVEGFMVSGNLKYTLSLADIDDLAIHAEMSDRGGGMQTKLKAAADFVRVGDGRVAHIARAGRDLESILNSQVGTTVRS